MPIDAITAGTSNIRHPNTGGIRQLNTFLTLVQWVSG